jgi:hypothetical protein
MTTALNLITLLDGLHPLGEDCKKELEKYLILMRLRKRQRLPDSTENGAFHCFVLAGCLRGFYVSGTTEVTTQLLMKGAYTVSDQPLPDGQPTNFIIEAVEGTYTALLDVAVTIQLQGRFPALGIAMGLLCRRQIDEMNQHKRLLQLKPALRLKSFAEFYPVMMQQLTVEQVASYLSISKVTCKRQKSILWKNTLSSNEPIVQKGIK